MPKNKSNKSVAKRIKVTKTGKMKKRTCGQGHFNAREGGNTTRNKRRDNTLSNTLRKIVKRSLLQG